MAIRCLRNALTLAAILATSGMAMGEARVVRPAIDEMVHTNTGTIQVVVEDVPRGLLLQPLLDGEVVGSEPVGSPVFYVGGVTRGTHELVVVLVDADAREVGRTPPITFHVWHASRLFRHGRR